MWVWQPEGRDSLIGTLRRGTSLDVDDSGTQQIIKNLRGLASEQFQDVYRPQPHGFSSNPPTGSEGIFLSLGGRSDRLLALGFEHKDKRPKNLPAGASVLYDAQGNVVRMMMANGIQIDASAGKVYVKPGGGQNVYLGGTGADGSYAPVSTVSGPAVNVLAKIG
jgi:phage gp45-like